LGGSSISLDESFVLFGIRGLSKSGPSEGKAVGPILPLVRNSPGRHGVPGERLIRDGIMNLNTVLGLRTPNAA